MFTLCLIIKRFSLSIFTFANCHVAHSTILLITFFHFVPHVLILNKCLKGSNMVLSFGYSNDFFVILQVFSSMLESNMYSIIHSNVFGVTFGEIFSFCHWSRKVLQLQACDWIIKVATRKYLCKYYNLRYFACKLLVEWKRMQFHCASIQGVEKVNEN